ncbi:e3 ubiquitin-protein ligase DCST1 [Trichonephila clavipes]|nr:e3 ubiquitin-protein ligase DCST1 [Trichonephila clavipes]
MAKMFSSGRPLSGDTFPDPMHPLAPEEIEAQGAHHIKMTIFGDGFVGNMVRSIMKGFDKKHSVDEVTTTAECLPQPTKLELKTIYTIYGLFLLIFILALFQSYFMRMRRVICSFYYPKVNIKEETSIDGYYVP